MPAHKVDPQLRKEQLGIKLPKWLIDWLSQQSVSRAVLVEQAVCKVHKLKPPK